MENFPEKHIKRGKFKLHAGGEFEILYDINSLLTDKDELDKLIREFPKSEHYVGIATGGAVLAAILSAREFSRILSRVGRG